MESNQFKIEAPFNVHLFACNFNDWFHLFRSLFVPVLVCFVHPFTNRLRANKRANKQLCNCIRWRSASEWEREFNWRCFCDCIDLIVGRLFCPVLILIHSKTKLKLQLTEHSTEWNLSGPLQKDIHSFNRWTDDERKNNHPFSFILTWIYPLHRWCNGFWSPIKFKWNIR